MVGRGSDSGSMLVEHLAEEVAVVRERSRDSVYADRALANRSYSEEVRKVEDLVDVRVDDHLDVERRCPIDRLDPFPRFHRLEQVVERLAGFETFSCRVHAILRTWVAHLASQVVDDS